MGLVLYPDDYDKDPVTGTVTDLPDGVVFLPAAGFRGGSDVYDSSYGFWSSTASDVTLAYYVTFASDNVFPGDYVSRYYGYSVRLVTEVPAPGSTIEDFNKKNDDPGNWN